VLRWVGTGGGVALAGCGSEDPAPGIYASNAQVVYRRGDDRFDYPDDVGVRVTVENTASDRMGGRLVTTLERLGDRADGATPAAVQTWRDEREISLSRGTSRAVFVVFEGAGSEGSRYRAGARLD
jgi:hypothetical protein